MKTLCVLLLFASMAFGQTFYTFSGPDGANPTGTLVFDSQGNLYGTTEAGGAFGLGTIYEVTPQGEESVIYSFTGPDSPTTGLVIDQDNLYGSTAGVAGQCPPACGMVFEFSAGQLTVLHKFAGGKDGGLINGPVAINSGAIYGTTAYGPKGYGTVFKIDVGKKTILHSFAYDKNGAQPFGNLVIDSTGAVYGATAWAGGTSGFGTIFRIASGKLSTLHRFGPSEKQTFAGISMDAQGMIYGTMPISGGKPYVGTAYTLTPKPTGGWLKTTVCRFSLQIDGDNPLNNPIADQGNLFGTTIDSVYELSEGTWPVKVLQWFQMGDDPRLSVPAIGPDGNLYVATKFGGTGSGAIYRITGVEK